MSNLTNLEACWLTLNRTCNLRCYFCYARGTGYDVNQTMNYKNAKFILDFCKEASIKHLILIGGEPTLYPELFSLLNECSKNSFNVHLSTNGLNFANEEFCDRFFSIIKPSINISIKGHNSKAYKETTSFDSYPKLLKAFENLKNHKIDFHVSYVITEENIDYFLIGVKKAFELGATALHLSFAYDFSTNYDKNKDYFKNSNPLLKIKRFTEKINEIDNITKGMWDFENGYPLCFYSQKQLSSLGKHLATGCQMLFGDGILFDTDLNVIPCNSMYSVKMGRLGENFNSYDEYLEYVQKGTYKDVRDYLQSLPSKDCLSCDKVEFCGGGCTLFWSQTSFEDAKKYLRENSKKYDLKIIFLYSIFLYQKRMIV